jgi:hypothetical protein
MTRSMTAQAIVRQLVSPREPADHLGSPPDLLERALQQVGRAESLLQPQRIGEADGQCGEVVGQARRGRGVLGAELADEDPQPMRDLRWAR